MFIILGHFFLISSILLIMIFYIIYLYFNFHNKWIIYFFYNLYFILITCAISCLFYCYVHSEFSLLLTTENSSYKMPILYKICCLWGSHEGSIFFWVWILSFYGFGFVLISGNLSYNIVLKFFLTFFYIILFFLFFTIGTSNPFLLLSSYFGDGIELNPILQDPGLIIHPPFLYLGYLGYSITFTLAFAGLLEKNFTKQLYQYIRFFNYISWLFLTFGIFLGSWWAYHELGWGGWWFWDPVENFSLLPWISSTALMHSLLLTIKNDKLLIWNFFLSIFIFILSIFGTFFVRSGLLTSVHSFVADPARGTFIFLFLCSLIFSSLYLIYKNYKFKINFLTFDLFVGKSLIIIINNVLLLFYLFCILLGTILPVIYLALQAKQITIGTSFFNLITIILFIPAIFWLNLIPFVTWKNSNSIGFVSILLLFIIALVLAIISSEIPRYFGFFHNIIGTFVLILSIILLINNICIVFVLHKIPNYIVGHLSLALFFISIILSSFVEQEVNCILQVGEQIALGDSIYTLRAINNFQGSNYNTIIGDIISTDSCLDKIFAISFPEHRLYFDQGIHLTKAVVITNVFKDFYIIFGGGNFSTGWAFQIIEKPFIVLIWLSVFLSMCAVILGLQKTFFELNKIK